MLDLLLRTVVVELVLRILRIVFFPVALLVCTPFILVRGVVLAARRRARFARAVADGYYAVDISWWS